MNRKILISNALKERSFEISLDEIITDGIYDVTNVEGWIFATKCLFELGYYSAALEAGDNARREYIKAIEKLNDLTDRQVSILAWLQIESGGASPEHASVYRDLDLIQGRDQLEYRNDLPFPKTHKVDENFRAHIDNHPASLVGPASLQLIQNSDEFQDNRIGVFLNPLGPSHTHKETGVTRNVGYLSAGQAEILSRESTYSVWSSLQHVRYLRRNLDGWENAVQCKNTRIDRAHHCLWGGPNLAQTAVLDLLLHGVPNISMTGINLYADQSIRSKTDWATKYGGTTNRINYGPPGHDPIAQYRLTTSLVRSGHLTPDESLLRTVRMGESSYLQQLWTQNIATHHNGRHD